MIEAVPATIPPPGARCRLTVVIPARNEAELIPAALRALRDQRDFDGSPLPAGVFDTIVVANNCTDETATVVRNFAAETPRLALHLVQEDLPAARAHVGAARRFALDLAAARFEAAGQSRALLASTDADTIVDSQWIAWTLREARQVDAVAGYVSICAADEAALLPPVRLLYARERAYREVLAEIEALVDPRPEDPQPRHSSFVGASFAVTVAAYRAAGGLPPLPNLEDLHFRHALTAIDARIRYSVRVRATTSARTIARVSGGFGSFLAGLHAHSRSGTFCVEHPAQTLAALRRRAGLRKRWELAGGAAAGEPFGRFCERSGPGHVPPPRYRPLVVELAIEQLRSVAAALRRGRACSAGAAP